MNMLSNLWALNQHIQREALETFAEFDGYIAKDPSKAGTLP